MLRRLLISLFVLLALVITYVWIGLTPGTLRSDQAQLATTQKHAATDRERFAREYLNEYRHRPGAEPATLRRDLLQAGYRIDQEFDGGGYACSAERWWYPFVHRHQLFVYPEDEGFRISEVVEITTVWSP